MSGASGQSAALGKGPHTGAAINSVAKVATNPRLPVALFCAALVVSGGLLLALTSQLTFFLDDWDVLLHRRGFSVAAFFTDHAGHPSMGLVAVYKAIQAIFGMEDLAPYAVASTASFLASVALLFVWMRRRVGDWLALAATLPLLFLGTGAEDLLTPFQIGFFVPMACGIGAMLALERRDRRGDAICCALLVVAVCFQTLGLIWVAAAAVAIGLDRELRARFWVFAVPAAIYALWYLGWGDSDANQLSFENVATAPAYVVDGYASSLSSLLGLAAARDEVAIGALDWGRPLLALAVIAVAARLVALGRVPKWFWVVLAAGVVFWFLTAINATYGRSATTSRYQYVGVILILMAAGELGRGWRPNWRVIAIVLAASLAATAANVAVLRDHYQMLKAYVPVVRGSLAGLEIGRDTVDPGLLLDQDNAGFNFFTLVDAGPYLSAVDAFGSPAYSVDELAEAPTAARVSADRVTADALGLRPQAAGSASGCGPPGSAGEVAAVAPGESIVVRAEGPGAELRLRRYASGSFPVELGPLAEGEAVELAFPVDGSSEPWELELGGTLVRCQS